MTFALLLDITIAFLLGGTIFFVWRLSDQLARFRASRTEMDRLVRDLNMSVDRAQGAIIALREAAQNSGEELQKKMRQATELSDELQMINESANSLATRLENAASRVRANDDGAGADYSAPRKVSPPTDISERDTFPAFAIRDPEFDGRGDDSGDNHDLGDGDDLRSEAEKELFRALQQNKKTPRLM